jgi:hypothetical protein
MAPSGVGHEIGVWVVFGSVFSLSIEGSIGEVGKLIAAPRLQSAQM